VSNMSRSLKHLRDQGYHADVCERWMPFRGGLEGGVRKDLFGFIDILAYTRTGEIAAVQCTSKQQMTRHLRDYRRHDPTRQAILDWLYGGRAFALHGWHQPNGKGTRWQLEQRIITAADLELTEADKRAIERKEDDD